MEEIVIGVVTLVYDMDGLVIRSSFAPEMGMNLKKDDPIINQLQQVKCAEDSNLIKSQADLMLGAWFNKVSDIEIADRTEYEIHSEVIMCNKYSSGQVGFCSIKYTFRKIP